MFGAHGSEEARNSTQQLLEELLGLGVAFGKNFASSLAQRFAQRFQQRQLKENKQETEINLGDLVLAADEAHRQGDKDKAKFLFRKTAELVEEKMKFEPEEIREKLKNAKMSEKLKYLHEKYGGLENIKGKLSLNDKRLKKVFQVQNGAEFRDKFASLASHGKLAYLQELPSRQKRERAIAMGQKLQAGQSALRSRSGKNAPIRVGVGERER